MLKRWFAAESHGQQLMDFVRLNLEGQQVYHCLDVFGASGRVKQTWERSGYHATAFDIKLDERHDICGLAGVLKLLQMGLQIPGGT